MTVSEDVPRAGAEAALGAETPEAFSRRLEPHRRELLVHAYRMLGSIEDAEDAVQDALVRAWNGRSTFRRAISFRAWLYRITTNACLDAIARRGRRVAETSLEIGPFPDRIAAAEASGPEARYDERESVSLAFVVALQVLPPRQRAALLLRDVLGMRAAEVADLLEVTVPAVNGALLRARAALAARSAVASRGDGPPAADRPARLPHDRALVDRYVRAWEAADVPSIVALLREDAALRMPPRPAIRGAAAIGAFLASDIFLAGARAQLVPVEANGRPGFLARRSGGAGGPIETIGLLVLETTGGAIDRIDAWTDPRVLAWFEAAASAG